MVLVFFTTPELYKQIKKYIDNEEKYECEEVRRDYYGFFGTDIDNFIKQTMKCYRIENIKSKQDRNLYKDLIKMFESFE